MTPEEFKSSAEYIMSRIRKSAAYSAPKWHVGTEHHSVSFLMCDLSTWDRDSLTMLVIGCHEACMRAEVHNGGPDRIKVCLSSRATHHPEFPIMRAHPTIDQAIRRYREELSVYDIAKELETER